MRPTAAVAEGLDFILSHLKFKEPISKTTEGRKILVYV
jgi:hypothetical protein